MSLEKIAQNIAQPIFVSKLSQLLPWKKVAQQFGMFLYFSKNHEK
jgi:hypothetical protein